MSELKSGEGTHETTTRASSVIEFTSATYSKELNEDIGRLFQQEGFERSPDYLAWAHSPPTGDGLIALAHDSDASHKIVGVMSFVPTPVWASGEVLESYLAVDLVVDQDCRGRGVFSGLANVGVAAVAETGAALVWGFPNSQAAHGWFNRFDWVRLGAPPLMVRPLRTGLLARKLGPMFGWADIPLTRCSNELDGTELIDRFGCDADSLWEEVSKGVACCTPRDSTRLNWRTVDVPEKDYRRIGVFGNGQLNAFVITTRQEKRGVKLLYFMEALSRSAEYDVLLAQLIRQELADAAASGVEIALCWSPAAGPNRKAYSKAGFLPLPPRLHPTEGHFGVRPLHSGHGSFLQKGSWYISYLDLDVL